MSFSGRGRKRMAPGRPILASSSRQDQRWTLALPSPEAGSRYVRRAFRRALWLKLPSCRNSEDQWFPSCLSQFFRSSWDAGPEWPQACRPNREGLESARSMAKTGSGRRLTFCADGGVRLSCGDRISLPRCQRVLAACALEQSSEDPGEEAVRGR